MNPRILKEIRDAKQCKEYKFVYDEFGRLGEPNSAYIKFHINNGGSYQDQTHILKIKFNYGGNLCYKFPKDPPNIIFLTPILHTNISISGSICLDVIQTGQWSPCYNLETIFHSIIALLDEPNTKSPFNSDAAKIYNDCIKKNDIKQYQKICNSYYNSKIQENKQIQALLTAIDIFDD